MADFLDYTSPIEDWYMNVPSYSAPVETSGFYNPSMNWGELTTPMDYAPVVASDLSPSWSQLGGLRDIATSVPLETTEAPWYSSLLSGAGNALSGMSLKDWGSLGTGALSMYLANRQAQQQEDYLKQKMQLEKQQLADTQARTNLAEDQFALPSALDWAKTRNIAERMVDAGKMTPQQMYDMLGSMYPAYAQTLTQPQYNVSNAFRVNPFGTPIQVSQIQNPAVVARADGGVLRSLAPQSDLIQREMYRGGPLGLLRGGTSGQSDQIDARLSDGEYVFDADTVSALGDGNTEAGAKKLDQMRVAIRKHKRSANPKKIPPKAKTPERYMED